MEGGGDEFFASYCLHNLVAVDITPIREEDASEEGLVGSSEVSDEGRLAFLPARQTFPIPRVRKIPVEKPKTRWQKFAEEQNIHKRKRSRLVWDDLKKDWVPRWGYGSKKNSRQKIEEAIIEMAHGEDLRDVIENRRASSKLSKKKQEYRELRNQMEATRTKLPKCDPAQVAVAALGRDDRKKGKDALSEMSKRAAVSTASFGVHDKPIKVLDGKSAKTHQKKSRT